MRLAISTTETLTDLKTDLVVANNNNIMKKSAKYWHLFFPLKMWFSEVSHLSAMIPANRHKWRKWQH